MRSVLRAAVPTALFVLQAFPAAATAEPPPIEAYGELPRVEDAAISPNGDLIASVTRFGSERHVLVVDKDGNVRFNADTGEGKVRGIDWADDDTVLLTSSVTVPLFGFTTDKSEMNGTVLIPLKAGNEHGLVFGKSRGIVKATRGRYGMRTIDGRTVGYFGGIALDTSDRNEPRWAHGRTTLYAVDIASNKPRVAARPAPEDHYRDWLIDASGAVSVTLDIDETNGVWTISTQGGLQLARGVDPTGDVSLVAFGRAGSSVIYRIEDDAGVQRWFEVPLTGGTPQEYLRDVPVERLFVDRTTGNLIGYRTMEEVPRTVMDDPAQQSALTRIFKAFAGREVRLVDWTPGFAKVLLRTSGNGDSGTWYIVDVARRRADPVANERPEIDPEQVGAISQVDYTAQDGLGIDGVLTLPPGREAKGLAVVMLPHGGPAAYDKPDFDWWAQAFASRGYAVFQPNFRGSTGRGDAFRHAGDGQWGRKMQTDISDGLAELARRGIVDAQRACIVGASYGGYAALAGVTIQQGLYKCAVSVAGVADIKLMYDTDVRESGGSRMLGRSLDEQLGDRKGFDAASPRRFAAQADAPVLLIHGKDDTVVPYRQSTVMADALKDAGKPYELVTLAGEDHWLSREETRKQMLAATIRFVQRYNPAD